jgi:hypothetical protein
MMRNNRRLFQRARALTPLGIGLRIGLRRPDCRNQAAGCATTMIRRSSNGPTKPLDGCSKLGEHLFLLQMPVLTCPHDAAMNVLLEHKKARRPSGRHDRRDLREDVQTRLILLDHFLYTSDLPLHQAEAGENIRLVRGMGWDCGPDSRSAVIWSGGRSGRLLFHTDIVPCIPPAGINFLGRGITQGVSSRTRGLVQPISREAGALHRERGDASQRSRHPLVFDVYGRRFLTDIPQRGIIDR